MEDSTVKKDHASNQIFGSFLLGQSEFALAVSHVQEVVNAPSQYTAIPLAPKYLKGLFNLRGAVIPVLDLRDFLQLPAVVATESQKIAIIELEDTCVGLLFDTTAEIFRSNDEERCDFNENSESSVVSGVFKKDDGKRIVQILDVNRIFKLQNIPKDTNRNRQGRNSFGKNRGNRKQCISFVVGPAKCALAISDIQEILKVNQLNESALGVGHCIGTIDLRGSTVPIVDFPALLSYREVDRSPTATTGDRRIIIMRLEKEFFGLLVDSVDSIISYFPDELVGFPMMQQRRVDMFLGCITGHGDKDILLLNNTKILSDSEINEITRGHSKIYQSKTAQKNGASTTAGMRHTYITFKIGNTYAISISDVKEIIEYPATLLQPPGLNNSVRGVLNLRGNLVTIIDARKMYAAEKEMATDQKVQSKVLVFERNGTNFGLVVDSVESIVTFGDNEKVKLPQLLYSGGPGTISSEVSEAVEITDTNGNKRSMLILSADSIASKVTESLAA